MFQKYIIALISLFTFEMALANTLPGEQASKQGFNTCQKTVEKIAKHIVEDAAHGAISTWNKSSPDSRLFNSQVVIKHSDGYSVSFMSVAPVKGGKCDGSYAKIANSEKSCSILRETIFKQWKFFNEVGGLVSLENDSGSVSVLLLPNQIGCTIVRSEILYE